MEINKFPETLPSILIYHKINKKKLSNPKVKYVKYLYIGNILMLLPVYIWQMLVYNTYTTPG